MSAEAASRGASAFLGSGLASTPASLRCAAVIGAGASVSGFYYSHPQAQYFVVGRLARDQVADYAERKGWTLAEAERWLSPNLGYEPED